MTITIGHETSLEEAQVATLKEIQSQSAPTPFLCILIDLCELRTQIRSAALWIAGAARATSATISNSGPEAGKICFHEALMLNLWLLVTPLWSHHCIPSEPKDDRERFGELVWICLDWNVCDKSLRRCTPVTVPMQVQKLKAHGTAYWQGSRV